MCGRCITVGKCIDCKTKETYRSDVYKSITSRPPPRTSRTSKVPPTTEESFWLLP